MPRFTASVSTPWLSRFAAFTAAATLGLIALGGLVTSHGAGMAVPDWPTTYGYNMFLFPISQWVGGIFYEHTHRLYASAVGFLTIILALWIQLRGGDRRLALLGWLALLLVIVQGVLGGLRVSLMKDQIGILHASLAQGFLVLLALLALRTSPRWRSWTERLPSVSPSTYRWVLGTTVAIFLQLGLGATMRHQHAGLAVPDFPLAYGRVWPRTDEAFLQGVNARRTDTRDFRPITAFQVQVHMAHRLLGVAVAAGVVAAALRLRRTFGAASGPGRLAALWMGLIGVQVGLGAITVWSNKAADMATAHVVVGAVCLVLGALGSVVCRTGLRRAVTRAAGSRAVPGKGTSGDVISGRLTAGVGAKA